MGIKDVKLIPDAIGNFTRFMGMLIGKNHLGFGMRSWRYMLLSMTELLRNGGKRTRELITKD